MLPLDQVKAINATLVKSRPLVAVFTAGVGGIGNYAVLELVKAHGITGAGLRIYIIGRKDALAAELIEECRELCPQGDFRYVKVEDLTLLRCVDKCCAEIVRLEWEAAGESPKIDILCMTQGQVDFGGRLGEEIEKYRPRANSASANQDAETAEGLDKSMSLLYYSRILFIERLAPLLATSTDHPSHIISVYAAGAEKMGTFHPQDLSLRGKDAKGKPNYSFSNCRTNVVYMTTMMFEHLAQQYQGKMALLHVWPKIVITPAYKADYHVWWFKILLRLMVPILRFVAVSPEEIGQRLVYCANTEKFPPAGAQLVGNDVVTGTDGVPGGGAYAISYTGDDATVQKHYEQLRKEGFKEKVVEHTTKAFKAIENAERFVD